MRIIDRIVIHCSATKPDQTIGVKEITEWHKKRGFNTVGYHYVIRRDGTTEDGRPNQQVGAHAKGFNKTSIGICLVGGLDENGNPQPNFTTEQVRSLRTLVAFLKQTYKISSDMVIGHRDLPGVNKQCPCFQVNHWMETGKLRA